MAKDTTKNCPPLIEASQLKKILHTENLILIDATNGKTAENDFLENHISGAFFADTNTQLSEIKADTRFGGRHPLPSFEAFCETVGNWGITPESHVVIYDSNFGANAAARLWWMLKSIGHEKVQVLNGGFKSALKHDILTDSILKKPITNSAYPSEKWLLPTIAIKEVEVASKSSNFLIIDVREAKRYAGEYEPIDTIAGHIPSAINMPFTENLNESGEFLSPSELKKKYEILFQSVNSQNIIVHCGSGVTACHTILALAHAGFQLPLLFVGSWSEWSLNGKEIA